MPTPYLLRTLDYQADVNRALAARGLMTDGPALEPAELAELEPSFDAGVPVSDFVEWVAERRAIRAKQAV